MRLLTQKLNDLKNIYCDGFCSLFIYLKSKHPDILKEILEDKDREFAKNRKQYIEKAMKMENLEVHND